MRIITFATESYFPGTRALLRSLMINSKLDQFEFIVMTEGKINKAAEVSIAQIKPDTKFVSRESLGEFKLDHITISKPNFKIALQKLLIFKLPLEGVNLYIDSDMICIGDLRDAKEWKHFTAPIVFGISLPHSVNGRPMFTGGIFAFEASIALFDRLQEFALKQKSLSMPDQDILNRYFSEIEPEIVRYVGIEWEMLRRIYRHHPTIWRSVANKKLIHFVGRKPWQLPEEPEYRELNKLWRKYA